METAQLKLPVLKGPGMGFELDWDAISQAGDLYNQQLADNRQASYGRFSRKYTEMGATSVL